MSSLPFLGFNDHHTLKGAHAFLGASKYHWLNYDAERLRIAYENNQAAERGTALHEFACNAIKMGIKLAHNEKTLNRYVNDAIGLGMEPEVVLYYSPNCFGTADAICYRNINGNSTLRIHDLKTGTSTVHVEQLMIYAALFCLEYHISPYEIKNIELRIYQNDSVAYYKPAGEEIMAICDTIIADDKLINEMKEGPK